MSTSMTTELIRQLSQTGNFLISFAAASCFLAIVLGLFRGEGGLWRWFRLAGIVALLALAVVMASLAQPDRNSVVNALKNDRTMTLLGGLCGVLAGLALEGPRLGRWLRGGGYLAYAASIALLCLMVGRDRVIEPMLRGDPVAAEGKAANGSPSQGPSAGTFHVEEFCALDFMPTAMTLGPDGKLYVAGMDGVIFQNARVVRLDPPDDGSGKVRAVTVAPYLNRPFGLAFHEGDLYVSRAGQQSRAVDGRIVEEPAGSITRLSDLDGDGKYDYYDDVIVDLPGAQLPDGLHQNNGIAWRPLRHGRRAVG